MVCRLAQLTEQLLDISNELIDSVADPGREQHLRSQRQELLAGKQALEQAPVQASMPSSSSGPFSEAQPGPAPSQPPNGAFGMPGMAFAGGGGTPYGQVGGLESTFPGGAGLSSSFSGDVRPPPAPLDRSVAAMQQDCRSVAAAWHVGGSSCSTSHAQWMQQLAAAVGLMQLD